MALVRTERLFVRVVLTLVEWSLLVLLLTFVLRRLAAVLLRSLVRAIELVLWFAAERLVLALLELRLVLLLMLRLLLEAGARRSGVLLRFAGRFSLRNLVRLLVQTALDLLQLGNFSCTEMERES